MVNIMHRICCISILVCGLFGGSFYVTAQECTSIPLSDPTRVVATPPQSGSNYSFYERVSLSCNATGEYTFTGNDYSYCEGNNQWSPDPATVICYEKCASSLIPADVIQVDFGGTTKSYYEHGEYIYLSCPASQTLIGPSTVTCLDGSIGDDAVSCAGGPTTAVYTTTQATTSSAPSTTAQQDETTLAFQTIINTVMGSTTSHDDSLTTRQPDVSTQVQTKPLTSMDYITTTPVITVDTSTVVPTDVSATTVQETTTGAPPFTEPSTENTAEATSMSTDIHSTMSTRFMSTDVYEATTFQTLFSTDTTGRTINTDSSVTVSTRLSTDETTLAITDEPITFSTPLMATDADDATTFQTLFSTDTPGRTINTDPGVTVLTRGSTDEATLAITDEPITFSTPFLATDADDATTFQTLFSTNTPGRTTKTDPGVTVSTRVSTDEATLASTDETVTFSTPLLATDADDPTTFQTSIVTDTPESTSGTESSITVSTDVATDGDATDTNPTTTMPTTEPTTTGFTELPQTDGNYVTTSATDVSATDDDVTTSPMEVTEVVTAVVTVTEVITEIDGFTTSPVEVTEVVTAAVTVTEVITEIDGFTTTTTPSGSDMTTTMVPDTCEGFCDPDRERCVMGLDGPECECLPGFYRITEDKSETDIQCTEAILFEVGARITEIDGQTVEFSEDLRNSSSARYNYLDDLICNAVASTQDSTSDFLVCQVTSFSDGSIIAAIELYYDELSNATEIEVYNETIAAFEENNITAEVTRVELVVPSIPTTVSAASTTQATTAATTTEHGNTGMTSHTSEPMASSGTARATSETESSTTQFVTTAKPSKSTADTTLLVLYILIPVVAFLLLIAIGFILYQNKKVSAQYGAYNPGGKKPKESKTSKKDNASNKDTNGHVNTAFYDGIVTSVDEYTQTSGPQPSGDDRPDSGVVVTEDIDHMVYPYPWNEPGRLEDDDDDKAIYAKVNRKSAKEVTHKNPPVIVEIELKPVVVEEPQSPPVDWAAVDPELGAVEKETSVTEAVKIDSDHNSDDQVAVDGHVDDTENEEHEGNDTGSQTEVDDEPDHIVIEGFEHNASSSNDGSTSKDDETLNLDAISLELMSTMENEIDKRLNRSTPC